MVTVAQLKERLESYPDDAEVLMMQQFSWPFEYSISGTYAPGVDDPDQCTWITGENRCGLPAEAPIHTLCQHDGEEDASECPNQDSHDFEPPDTRKVVFIVEGNQERYGNRIAWENEDRFLS